MSISKVQREAKEVIYKSDNNNENSVCIGRFYIKNRKQWEECKNCKNCAKFKNYKSKTENNPEVTYIYVDSFRECELYKQQPKNEEKVQEQTKKSPSIPYGLNKSINRLIETNTPKISVCTRSSLLKQPMSSYNLQCDAYERMSKNHGDLLAYITWSELFAIEVMNKNIEELIEYFKSNPLCKRDTKKYFNTFVEAFNKYKSYIRKMCYNGDEDAVIDIVKEVSFDTLTLRISINNYLNKFKADHSSVKAYMLTCYEIMEEVMFIHGENEYNAQKKEKNLKLSDFLTPKVLMSTLNKVLLSIQKLDTKKDLIDLNKDINITNGIKVIRNKMRDYDRIAKVINNVYLVNKRNQK